LYLTSGCKEECSRFIRNLDPKLFNWENVLGNRQLLPVNDKVNYQHLFFPYSSISEIIGERGEVEVLELLLDNQKIKFGKLVESWKEIDYLEIDIYAETKQFIFLIEVKSWSESFY
jgi:hypothetical protein